MGNERIGRVGDDECMTSVLDAVRDACSAVRGTKDALDISVDDVMLVEVLDSA
jgi:hypothetical protein